jgi:hypothetical protein
VTYYIEFEGEAQDVSLSAPSDQEAVQAALRRPDGDKVFRIYRRPSERRQVTVYEAPPLDNGDPLL